VSETKQIFTNGCFDILHKGHIELLKFCKSLGYVTVGLNSDTSVAGLKGVGRPINSEEDRKFLLQSLKYVDRVIIFNESTPLRLIEELRPDIVVKGGDYAKADVVGNEIAEVLIFNTVEGYSTTKTLNKALGTFEEGENNS
jgi:D-beta-D-heptose 7-phosphate kinase/D-beta-D-heptose 1-phosphate adenosyltransferase